MLPPVFAIARTFALHGVAARPVRVEVDVGNGLPNFFIVGLPDTAVREARERVRGALQNSGFDFPMQRIVANLAPADLPKVGPAFDLAIAVALLAASGQLPVGLLERYAFAGELALDGSIRAARGVLAMAEAANGAVDGIVVAPESGPEAALVPGLEVLSLERLDQLVELASGEWRPAAPEPLEMPSLEEGLPDIADLRGQPYLRRALEVVAAGGHSLLMIGPPGAGKSMAARRLPSLMPPLGRAEALETTRIASACGQTTGEPVLAGRPFRAPHHTISSAGLVGGGSPPRPGEVTLAHKGILFLDELGEFSRPALEALRQPLEDGRVTITRAGHSVELPCGFILVAAANPCPCGRGPESDACRCAHAQISRYEARLSGALADRIDICVAVNQPSPEAMAGEPGECSADVRARVETVRRRQQQRLGPGRCNSEMTTVELRRHCRLDRDARRLMRDSHARLGLSGRGHERVLRLSRTIADIAGCERIGAAHIAEALALRNRGE
jgi:magnesium chelatase family protein